jgi:MFS family permease
MVSRKETRTLGLAALGATLEYYDFVVYLFVAAALSKEFFPPDVSPWIRQLQTFGIFAIGYLVRPVAGMVAAHFGDKVGRKKMFIFLIILMAVPTFLIGVLPTYAQVGWYAPLFLLILRALQGCAVGGELPGAAVFVSEHAGASRIGGASGFLHGVVHLGLLLGTAAAALAGVISAHLDLPSLAWRLPFIIGGLFGLTAAYLRRQLEESPLYAEIVRSKQVSKTVPLKVVVSQYRRACLFGFGLMFVQAVLATVFFQYMQTVLITVYGVSTQMALNANMFGILALALSMPIWGQVSDRIGWSKTLLIGAVGTAVSAVYYFQHLASAVTSATTLSLLFAIAGIPVGAIIGLVPGLLSSLFPTQVRQSGYALPYNVGAALFAGLAPFTLAWLVRGFGPTVALYPVLLACAVALVLASLVSGMRLYLGREAELQAPSVDAIR